jgi:UDP-N-acetylglucosamine acyltransferase
MPKIHPTAVIEHGAQIADDVEVGPFCYVGAKATIGEGCRLVSHVVVIGRTTLGKHNTVWPQAVLGADPQDLKFHGEDSQLVVGDHNQIRESVTMQLGTENGGWYTRVGSHNLIMVGCHVAHDCEVGDHVVMANSVGLAGHVIVEDYASIGGAVGVHHFVTFGAHCFVGGMSRIVHDVPPFMIAEGDPAAVRAINSVGLVRRGFSQQQLDTLKSAHKRLFRGAERTELSMPQRLAELESIHPEDANIRKIVAAIRNSLADRNGRYRESLRRDGHAAARK